MARLDRLAPPRLSPSSSADAAGLAILPGLVRYEEVAAGQIDHMVRLQLPGVEIAGPDAADALAIALCAAAARSENFARTGMA